MANRIEAEIVQESLTSGSEVVSTDDADTQMQDVTDAMSEYIANKKAEHPEWYPDETEQVQSETETKTEPEQKPEKQKKQKSKVEAEADTEEQAGSEDTNEPESQVLKRVLAREAKFRKTQKDFETQKAEFESQLQAFEEVKRLAKVDPVRLLQNLGLTDDNLVDAARALYYKSLGDMAPDEYKGKQEALELRREIEVLKQELKREEVAEKPEVTPEQEAFIAYQEELVLAAEDVVAEEYPIVAEKLGEHSAEIIAADMLTIASEYAREKGGRGRPLTPDKILPKLEARYRDLFGKAQTQDEDDSQKAVKKVSARKSTTLSNSLNKNQPPDNPISEDMSYEEIAKRARANFNKIMGG